MELEGIVIGYQKVDHDMDPFVSSLYLSLDVDGYLKNVVVKNENDDLVDSYVSEIKKHSGFFKKPPYVVVNCLDGPDKKGTYKCKIERIKETPKDKLKEFKKRKNNLYCT